MYAEFLQELRRKRKMSAKEISRKVGVSEKVYYNWEAGRTNIPADCVLDICRTFKISTEYFLTEGHPNCESDKFDLIQGIYRILIDSPKTHDYISWLYYNSEIDLDGMFMMLCAYGLVYPSMRRHQAALVWHMFEGSRADGKVTDKDMADILYKNKYTSLPNN